MALAPVLLAADSIGGQSSFLRDLPAGKYEGFFLKLSATSDTGLALTAAEFGRIRLLEAGRELASVDYDNLRLFNNLKGGYADFSGATAGDTRAACYIPRGYFDNNVHQVTEADVAQVSIQYGSSFATDIVSGQQKVYGLVRETGEMSYNLLLTQIDQTYGSGTFTLPIRQENVLAIYFIEPTTGTDLERVRVLKDGQEMVNIQAADGGNAGISEDLYEISDILNNPDISTGHSAIAEIQIAHPGEIGEFLSDDIRVEMTTGPTSTWTYETIVLSADFTPSKLRQTKVETAAVVQRKVSRKNTLGRGRPVSALRIASE